MVMRPDGMGASPPGDPLMERILSEMEALRGRMSGWLGRFHYVDVDDALQETFLRAVEHRSAWRGRNLRGWLFSILRSVAFSCARHRRRHRVHRYDECDSKWETLMGNRTAGDPLEAVVSRDFLEALLRAGNAIERGRRPVMPGQDGTTFGDILNPPPLQDGRYRARRFRFMRELRKRLTWNEDP